MITDFDSLMWVYRAVFTQTDAGGGIIKVTITASERTLLLSILTGSDNYAADRNISATIFGANNNNAGGLLVSSPVDNERLTFPYDNVANVVPPNNAGQWEKRVLLGLGESIVIQCATPAQNETLSVSIRALVENYGGEVSTTGSGGTVTTTLTHNRFI